MTEPEETEEIQQQRNWVRFEAQQDQIDQWVSELGERLKLKPEVLTKALIDWIVVNADADWLKLAADAGACDGSFGGGDLSEFLALATKAWRNAWGKNGDEIEDVLDQIEDLIDTYRDSQSA